MHVATTKTAITVFFFVEYVPEYGRKKNEMCVCVYIYIYKN